jgi:hypothetical protein
MIKEAVLNLGIEKLADKEEGKKKKGLKALGVGGGLGLAANKAQTASNRYFNRQHDKLTSGADLRKNLDLNTELMKKIKNKHKDISFNPKVDSGSFNGLLNKINFHEIGDGPETLAHEYGHYLNKTKSKVGKTLQTLGGVGNLARTANPLIAGAGVGAHKYLKDKDPEKAKKVRLGTLLGTGLSAAPTLIEEGMATRKGIDFLKKNKMYNKNHGKILGNAWGTYASGAAPFLASAGYFGYDALKDKLKARKQDESKKTSQ